MTDPARQHAHPAAEPLRDATLRARQALAAVTTIDPGLLSRDAFAALARSASVLRDVADELARIERMVERGRA